MIQKGSRVRHRNEEIDAVKGIMLVFEIKKLPVAVKVTSATISLPVKEKFFTPEVAAAT